MEMSALQSVLEKYTRGQSVIEQAYSEELPNADAIAKELGAQGVAVLLEEIARISAERDRLDREGEVNCDVLDDYWRTTTRLASAIPYQARLFPEQVLQGLSSESTAVRFYCAHSLSKVPFRKALLSLEAALSQESDQLNVRVMRSAVVACSSFVQCAKEQVGKLTNVKVVWRDA
jgi:hypothetical protein